MSSERVLVVDDEPKIREVVGAYLERQGYQVALSEDGDSALAAVTEYRPALVVLDLVLPDIPGEEVARALRGVSDVPIVMLTAKSSENDQYRQGAPSPPATRWGRWPEGPEGSAGSVRLHTVFARTTEAELRGLFNPCQEVQRK